MKENSKKQEKNTVYMTIIVCLISFVIGNITGYIFNPKCGNLGEKTKYAVNGIKNLLTNNNGSETVITEIPIECTCPDCSKSLEEDPCPIKADISGAVRNPGVYCFEEGAVIQDAVDKANGFDTAYGYKYISRKVNLAYEIKDNQKIYFPFKDDLLCELQNFSPEVEEVVVSTTNNEAEKDVKGETNTSGESNNNEEADNSGNSCISINNGTKEELMELNGVGESTAQKIIEGRPFDTLESILDVKGIGEATFEKFKDDICL